MIWDCSVHKMQRIHERIIYHLVFVVFFSVFLCCICYLLLLMFLLMIQNVKHKNVNIRVFTTLLLWIPSSTGQFINCQNDLLSNLTNNRNPYLLVIRTVLSLNIFFERKSLTKRITLIKTLFSSKFFLLLIEFLIRFSLCLVRVCFGKHLPELKWLVIQSSWSRLSLI